MLYEMSKYPFKHIDGVEITDYLCGISEKNLKKLKVEKARIFKSDASIFTDLDIYNYFYFFNPFPANVMANVMTNIKLSYEKKPREITIIYYVPLYEEEIIKSGDFKKTDNYWDVVIYKNNMSKNHTF